MSATGNPPMPSRSPLAQATICRSPLRGRSALGGFSLLELMAALAIAGLVLALSVPSTMKLYDNIRYRQAVRDVVTVFASARYAAINGGRAQNVAVDPRERSLTFNGGVHQLPESVTMTVHAARELNEGTIGVIRFYPDGSASGGGVDIVSARGAGVSINIDWLLGSVTQEVHETR